jgi:acyl-CoA thioesterase
MSDSTLHPIVQQMMDGDAMSQWLGIEVLESGPGVCTCRLTVREEMVNGFGIAHGAITYALADSTLAFAVNAQGQHAVSVTSTIQHLAAVQVGDVLTARAIPRADGGRIAHVDVEVTNQHGARVAWLTATGYRRSASWT